MLSKLPTLSFTARPVTNGSTHFYYSSTPSKNLWILSSKSETFLLRPRKSANYENRPMSTSHDRFYRTIKMSRQNLANFIVNDLPGAIFAHIPHLQHWRYAASCGQYRCKKPHIITRTAANVLTS